MAEREQINVYDTVNLVNFAALLVWNVSRREQPKKDSFALTLPAVENNEPIKNFIKMML